MKKNSKKVKFPLVIIAELVCYLITKIALISYADNSIYVNSLNIVFFLYFFCSISVCLYTFLSSKKTLIISTIYLILYSILCHLLINSILHLFTDTQGIINFAKYILKIYFICAPLIGFRFFAIKKANMTFSYSLIFIKIILLLITTFTLKHLFEVNGILYAIPITDFITSVISLFFILK